MKNVAKWDGATWLPLQSGTRGNVHALAIHDDGNGPSLYAGGSFGSAPDSEDSYLARWGCRPAENAYRTSSRSNRLAVAATGELSP